MGTHTTRNFECDCGYAISGHIKSVSQLIKLHYKKCNFVRPDTTHSTHQCLTGGKTGITDVSMRGLHRIQ
jgi:hypothetical protein